MFKKSFHKRFLVLLTFISVNSQCISFCFISLHGSYNVIIVFMSYCMKLLEYHWHKDQYKFATTPKHAPIPLVYFQKTPTCWYLNTSQTHREHQSPRDFFVLCYFAHVMPNMSPSEIEYGMCVPFGLTLAISSPSCCSGVHNYPHPAGWVYCNIYNAMQYHNTALETTALVMHDSNTFFYGVPPFLMALRISYIVMIIQKYHQ